MQVGREGRAGWCRWPGARRGWRPLRQETVTLPNSLIGKEKVINFTRGGLPVGIDLNVDAAYDAPPSRVKAEVLEALQRDPADPPRAGARGEALGARRLEDDVPRALLHSGLRGAAAATDEVLSPGVVPLRPRRHRDPLPPDGGDDAGGGAPAHRPRRPAAARSSICSASSRARSARTSPRWRASGTSAPARRWCRRAARATPSTWSSPGTLSVRVGKPRHRGRQARPRPGLRRDVAAHRREARRPASSRSRTASCWSSIARPSPSTSRATPSTRGSWPSCSPSGGPSLAATTALAGGAARRRRPAASSSGCGQSSACADERDSGRPLPVDVRP